LLLKDSAMIFRHALLAASITLLGISSLVRAQERTTEPAPLDPAADPVNRLVAARTVSGLIVGLRIDGAQVTLERARPARFPKPRARQAAGDTITITGVSGATIVSRVTVPNRALMVEEGRGLVRPERRVIYAALPTPRAIDAIEVRVSATAASTRLDVRAAYEEICKAFPREPVCAGRSVTPQR
jgi:hypothetical protein